MTPSLASLTGLGTVEIDVYLEDADKKKWSRFSASGNGLRVRFHYDACVPPQGDEGTEVCRPNDIIEKDELLPEVAESLKVYDVLAAAAAMWGMDVLTDYSKPSLPSPRSQLPTFSAFAPVLDAFSPRLYLERSFPREEDNWRRLDAEEISMSLADLLRHLRPVQSEDIAKPFWRPRLASATLRIVIPKTHLTVDAIQRAGKALASEAASEPQRIENRKKSGHGNEQAALLTSTGRAGLSLLKFDLFRDFHRFSHCEPRCAITGLPSRLCDVVPLIPQCVGGYQLMAALDCAKRAKEAFKRLYSENQGPRMFTSDGSRRPEAVAAALNYCLGDARVANGYRHEPGQHPSAGYGRDPLTRTSGWFLAPGLAKAFDRYTWLVTPRGNALHLVDADIRLGVVDELGLQAPPEVPQSTASELTPTEPLPYHDFRQANLGEAFRIPLLSPRAGAWYDCLFKLPLLHLATLSTITALFPGSLAIAIMRSELEALDIPYEAFSGQEEEEEAALKMLRYPEGRSEFDDNPRRRGYLYPRQFYISSDLPSTDTGDQDRNSDTWSVDADEVRRRKWRQEAREDLEDAELLFESRQAQRLAICWFTLMRRARAEVPRMPES